MQWQSSGYSKLYCSNKEVHIQSAKAPHTIVKTKQIQVTVETSWIVLLIWNVLRMMQWIRDLHTHYFCSNISMREKQKWRLYKKGQTVRVYHIGLTFLHHWWSNHYPKYSVRNVFFLFDISCLLGSKWRRKLNLFSLQNLLSWSKMFVQWYINAQPVFISCKI